ncbi:cell adhesion molecule 2-like [Tachysurus ichikawai]
MVATTVAPNHRDSAVVGVVILLVLCTLAGLVYLLYHYLCHNKGIYRTTGEAAPGVDPDQVYQDTVTENKEYFI